MFKPENWLLSEELEKNLGIFSRVKLGLHDLDSERVSDEFLQKATSDTGVLHCVVCSCLLNLELKSQTDLYPSAPRDQDVPHLARKKLRTRRKNSNIYHDLKYKSLNGLAPECLRSLFTDRD